ncbi:myosin heavy chain-related protein [Tanacetum coccineum]
MFELRFMASDDSDQDARYELSKLLQKGTVVEYESEFFMLIKRVTGISESLLKSFYIFGLKQALPCALLRSNPTTLSEAFSSARAMEARFAEDPLSKLLQRGTVAEYQNKFEMLISQVIGKFESLLTTIYIPGLKVALQIELLRARPTTLGEAFSLACIIKAHFETIMHEEKATAEKEQSIKETTDTITSLQSKVASLKAKGSLDANKEIKNDHTLVHELEKQEEKLPMELQLKNNFREALETTSKDLEKMMLDLNPTLHDLQKKAKFEATTKIRKLAKVYSAWLPPWLATRLVVYQPYVKNQSKEFLFIQGRIWDPGIKIFLGDTLRARWFRRSEECYALRSADSEPTNMLEIRSCTSEIGFKYCLSGLYHGIARNIASSAPISAIYTFSYESVKGVLLPPFSKVTLFLCSVLFSLLIKGCQHMTFLAVSTQQEDSREKGINGIAKEDIHKRTSVEFDETRKVIVVQILKHEPCLISLDVEGFYDRDIDSIKYAARMELFFPNKSDDEIVEGSVIMSRTMYAQLMQQTFQAPKGYLMSPRSGSGYPVTELGMEIACGFQMIYQTRKQEGLEGKRSKCEVYRESLKRSGYFERFGIVPAIFSVLLLIRWSSRNRENTTSTGGWIKVGAHHGVVSVSLAEHLETLDKSYQQEQPYDSKAGAELLDLILAKGGGYGATSDQTCTQVASSPPYFCGSPPSRVSNPLIQDARFGDDNVSLISPKSMIPNPASATSPSSSARKGGCCVRPNYGNKPAVRIEGFDCLDRDNRRNRSVPALA